ncbi:aminoacyltransferase [Streptococcus sciuri]|uniref:Aminoacyltransferase n=1 Tax=Streptococcus sciuri TaxID=2973939 RepID=A0ABT2F8J9_9STRE|nr:aminoacyltransferase [Streptococcus sciuri]MCS4488720.1 aminoacyltransferase [Streptococcus sciuri]
MLKKLSREAYEKFSNCCSERSFMQTVEMADLLRCRGFDVTYLGWESDGELTVAGLLYSMPERGGLRMEINSGPVSSKQEDLKLFYSALRDYAKENGALELLIKPYDTYQTFDSNGQATSKEKKELITDLVDLGYQFDGLQTGYPDGEPHWHYIKDLSNLDNNQLLKSFNKNSQRNIKKAKQLGITIRALERHELETFSWLVQKTGERQGFSSKDIHYYQQFFDSFQTKTAFVVAEIQFTQALNKLQTALTTANSKQEKASIEKAITLLEPFAQDYKDEVVPLAGALMIYLPSEVTYLFGGSDNQFKKLSAPFLLQYTTMLQAIDANIPLYNFLGIMGVFDGTDGVLRFKQNFNGYIVRKMGTFRYYPRPVKYKIIQGIKKLLGRY